MCARFFMAPLLFAAALAVGGCQGETGEAESESTSAAGAVAPATGSTTAAEAKLPDPYLVRGRGSTRETIALPREYRPLVLSLRVRGGGISVTVSLRGEGFTRQRGHSGALILAGVPYDGATATPGIAEGRYQLIVKAEGRGARRTSWTLEFSQPDPASAVTASGEVIEGEGAAVQPVRLEEPATFVGVLSETHFFSCTAIGYGGEAEGVEQFLGAIVLGGETPLDTSALSAGDYLFVIDADGPWTLYLGDA